ncbi:MAG TPA: hypothetical protein VGI95_11825 [Caulobacteraceae bacterium]|jgi:hypothetical protein
MAEAPEDDAALQAKIDAQLAEEAALKKRLDRLDGEVLPPKPKIDHANEGGVI